MRTSFLHYIGILEGYKVTTHDRTFHLYRYQIIPTVEDFQLDFITGIKSRDELISKKNDLFVEALKNKKEFVHSRAELTHKLDEFGNFLVLKLGANRSLVRTTRELETEVLDNWPFIYIVINNKPSVQIMAVELETKTFNRTSTVVNILETNLNTRLRPYKLEVRIVPTYLKREFWGTVKTHQHRITYVEFFMVAPNLANISKGLLFNLGEIKRRTNSINTNLSLKSPKGEGLILSQKDKFTKSLVDYTAEGGGTVHLKVKNIRKTIKV
jgi:hypothetical protein